MIKINQFLKNSLDLVVAWFVLFIGALMIAISLFTEFYYPLGLSITVYVASSIYLIKRPNLSFRKIDDDDKTTDPIQRSTGVFFPLTSSILVLFLSLTIIYFSVNSNRRPLWVYFVLALIPTLIFLWFFKYRNNPLSLKIIRSQIIIFTITFIVSSIFIFPHNGSDTWRHIANAENIVYVGKFDDFLGAYQNYPLYPFYIGLFSKVLQISLADSARFLTMLSGVIILLLFYFIAEKQKLSKIRSEILVLLLLGSKWFVYWNSLVVSMTFAILFFCLFLIIFLSTIERKSTNNILFIFLLIAFYAPFLHPMISAGIIIFLAIIWLVAFVDKKMFTGERTPRNIIVLLSIFTIFLITQWMYYGQQFFNRIIPSLLEPIFYDSNSFEIAQSYRDPLGYTLDQFSFFPILALGYFEVLRQIKGRQSRLNLYTGLIGIFFIFFAYVTQIISFGNVLPHRWLIIGTFSLILPASNSFVLLFPLNETRGRISAAVFVFLFFFSSFINTESNADHPIYSIESTIRLDVTSSEQAGFKALSNIIEARDTNVRFDFQVWDYLYGEYSSQDLENVSYWKEVDLENYQGVFSLRKLHFERPETFNMPFEELPNNNPDLSLFYDSGDFWLLEKIYISENEREP